MEKAKIWLSRLLLAFVIFSLGFAFGKMAARSSAAITSPAGGQSDEASAMDTRSRVVVYYFHATFRCTACNTIEETGKSIVENEFPEEKDKGLLEWKPVNFQENDILADKYNIAGNIIIVVRKKGKQDVREIRLEKVMELADREDELAEYIRAGIKEGLEKN